MEKLFEFMEKANDVGQRFFKLVLHEIYPDSCENVILQKGEMYNENGITWLKEFTLNNLPSLKNKSITAEFLNAEKTIVCGHGQTGYKDDVPVFEDAETIGHFTNGYIEEVTINGVKTLCAIGEGYLDEFRHKNLCDKLAEDLKNGIYPIGSVEFCHKKDRAEIEYKYGYKAEGRIPTVFDYSGWALLGVRPADDKAVMLELNNKEEKPAMNEKEILEIVKSGISEYCDAVNKIKEANSAAEAKVLEANASVEEAKCAVAKKEEDCKAKDAQIAELEAKCKKLEEEKCELQAEMEAKCKQLEDEKCAVQAELDACKKDMKKSEMNEAIKDFSEAEKEYAKVEIESFNENPLESDIKTIVGKIYEGIGKAAKTANAVEVNAAKEINIFGGIDLPKEDNKVEEIDIFA